MKPTPSRVAAAQAAYYVTTGVFPFVSRRRFQAVTGGKLEWWLVLSVGALVTAIGASLAVAARAGRADNLEMRMLGTGAAAGLAAIDMVYVARRRISPVYLTDAGLQLALLAAWRYRATADTV
jgi:hypothetical protein